MALLESMLGGDPFFADFDRLSRRLLGGGAGTGIGAAMPMDVLRRGEELLVRIDLPGVAPDSLRISTEGRTLTIEASRQPEERDGDVVFLRGRPAGTVRQQLLLPDHLDIERVQASYDNGVLTIRIPVAEHAKPRRIEIQTGAAADKQLTNTG
jgi:HSP20 family protein